MSQQLEMLLYKWGSYNEANIEHSYLLGSNILHACGILGGRVQDKGDGHRVLDIDTPYRLRRVDQALHRIRADRALAIKLFYVNPLNNDTGLRRTNKELADLMSLSEQSFMKLIKQGKKELDIFVIF